MGNCIGGTTVNDVEPADRGIAMVFQSYALYPHMTVEQNLSFGLRMNGRPRDDIARRVSNAALFSRSNRSLPGAQATLGRPAPARCDRTGHCA